METIFISIASYRDPELLPTLRDCIANAKNSKRLKFGICWQHDETENVDEFINDSRFKFIKVPYELAKGEIGVILAPTGVGKSTFTTKIANHAFNLGYNVLQIFFEDNPKIIQRKHFTLWTGIHPDELSENRETVMEKVKHIQSTKKNKLIMKKLPSDTVTMNQIKNQIRKMIAEGIKIDMIILDYIDCVVPDKNHGDEWKSEGSVMRGFEAMCHELDIAGWTATQGNRCVGLDTFVEIEGKGLIKIKDVVLGDKILTHEGYKDITHIFPIQKQPVYKIKTKNGKEIKVSLKHIFPTVDGFKSIRSGLNVGDKLYIKK